MNFWYLIFIIFISFNTYATDCTKPTMPSSEEWNNWLTIIKKEARDKGISEKTILKNLKNVQPQSKIIMRDRCQPESTITLNEYLY